MPTKSYLAVLGSDQKTAFLEWLSESLYAAEARVHIEPTAYTHLHMFKIVLSIPASTLPELEQWAGYFKPQ